MPELYFKDPLLKLNLWERTIIKIVQFSSVVFLAVSLPILLLSNFPVLRWSGIFLVLFFIDRLLHYKKGERSLAELRRHNNSKENLLYYLLPETREIIGYAYHKNKANGGNFNAQLLVELAKTKTIEEILRRLEIKSTDWIGKIAAYANDFPIEDQNRPELVERIENLVKRAFSETAAVDEPFIDLTHLFSALLQETDPVIVKLLSFFNCQAFDFRAAAAFGNYRQDFLGLKKLPATLGGFGHRPYRLRHRVMNRAWTARPTPTLDQYGEDLTDLARLERIGFLIGHKKEYDRLLDGLARPEQPNVLLVGEPGIGKSTLVAHLAFDLVKDRVPPNLFDRRLVSLNIGDLLANAEPGILADRLKKIVDEVFQAGNIILHIPEFSDLFRTGERGVLNAIDILAPIFQANAVPVVAEVFPQNFKKSVAGRTDILQSFEKIEVEEITQEEAMIFLVYSSLFLEQSFKIMITFPAIRQAVGLAFRYFRDKPLPSSADELLKQAFMSAQRQGLKVINEAIVTAVAAERSRIPLQKAGSGETEYLLNFEKIVHERLVDQAPAVKAVGEALRQYRSGLSRKGGPIAAFLFVGPTGVGKTELAKILAALHFGGEENMIRFDMSEYQEKNSISRFLGSSESGILSSLTEAVMAKPYSLVLLDEFEKAHPDILNLFLQVFDDGRLTDNLGRTVDFQNTIIIATSNAHSEFIKDQIESGKKIETVSEELKKKLTSIFRPELLNRFSDVIVFKNLSPEEIFLIAGFQLKSLAKVVKETHGLVLNFDENAVRKIAELGYSPIFGARPLRQAISENIKSVLAEKILKKEIDRGNELRVVWENEKFEFKLIA